MDHQLLLSNLSELFIFDDIDLEDEYLLGWIMSMGEPSIFSIQMMKDRGNSFFKEGNISLAVSLYKFALNIFCLIGFSASHDQQSTSSLALSLVLNLAACELKLSGYNQVCCYCNLVLKFDHCNVKALYRRGLAFTQKNLLTEALKDFERALQLDPSNKDANRELVAVVDRLAVNPNGKRIAHPFDLLGSSNKSKKPLFSDDVIDKCDVVSCSNVQLINNAVGSAADINLGGDRNSPDSTMDLDEFNKAEPLLPADDKFDTSDTSSTSPTRFSFSNKKQAKNKLNLSSQGYENLIQGKKLEFFYPRSMSFMRVCPLISKTIQTGTPLDEISGQAEVPLSSPLPKEQVQHLLVDLKNDEVAQEQVFQINKKMRISSDSAQVSKISAVQFEFVAVRVSKNRKSKHQGVSSHRRNGVTRARSSVHQRSRISPSVDFSLFLCRSIKKDEVARCTEGTEIDVVATRAKRKEADVFHFDEYYHPPYKKCRLNVFAFVSCSFRFASWLSSRFTDSGTPGFVL